MKIRFFNARILTPELEIKNGEVWTENDSIKYVGDEVKKINESFDREINLNENLILPGFKNAHAHSPMTFLRSYADDLPLKNWLYEKVFPMEAKLTPDDVYKYSKIAIKEYLTSGITSSFDMYFFPEAIAQASIDCGFRTILCGEINDHVETLESIEENYNKFNSLNPLISYQLGFHAEYTSSRHILEGIAKLSQKYKSPVFMHNSETIQEVNECVERYGTTPTALFESMGMFEYGGGGFHCIYLSDEDLQIFKKYDLWAVTNPASNLKLSSGIAPLCKLDEMGINLAIGTDGSASNNALDMFREMYLATVLQKINTNDASAFPAEKVLKMALSPMCLKECAGISEGMKADLTVIDLSMPNMQPINNIIKNLIYSGSKINVKMTMVNGNILYEDGKFSFD